MARRSALPGGALNRLMNEVKPRSELAHLRSARADTSRKVARTGVKRAPKGRLPGAPVLVTRSRLELGDPVVRYAASRGLVLPAGPMESLRLTMQMAMDVRDLAKRERIGVFTVVTRALAGYLHERDRG